MGAIALSAILAIAVLNLRSSGRGQRAEVLAMIALLVIWSIIAGATDNPDYQAYARRYELTMLKGSYAEGSLEPGFQLLMNACATLGLGFQAFIGVAATIGLAMIHWTVSRVAGASNFVYPLYLMYPLLFDAVQLRNFLALAVIVFGYGQMVERERWHRLVFAAACLIAASFHIVALIYVAILLVPRVRERQLGVWPVYIGLGMLVGALLLPSLASVFGRLGAAIAAEERVHFYVETRAGLGVLVPLALQFICLVLLGRASRAVEASSSYADVPSDLAKRERWVLLARNTCMLCFLLLPLYAYSSNFWRIPRNVHIVYYVAIFIGSIALRRNAFESGLLRFGTVVYTVTLLALYSNPALVEVLILRNAWLGALCLHWVNGP